MTVFLNQPIYQLIAGLLAVLSVASATRLGYGKTKHARTHPELHGNLKCRIRSWWLMIALFLGCCLAGKLGTVVLFAIISFLGLREFISQLNTHREDHGSLTWGFFIILPIQYLLIAFEKFEVFYLFIPIGGLAIVVFRNLLAGTPNGFLARTSQFYFALMICVYSLGFVPAITFLKGGTGLLLFFVICAQTNDVFQYLSGKLFGKTALAPNISPNKTLEGAIGGILLTTSLAALIHPVTPFNPLVAAGLGFGIACLGIGGDLLLSAIKRDLEVKDFGEMIPGHGGIMDRVDSLVIAAPAYYFGVRWLLLL